MLYKARCGLKNLRTTHELGRPSCHCVMYVVLLFFVYILRLKLGVHVYILGINVGFVNIPVSLVLAILLLYVNII